MAYLKLRNGLVVATTPTAMIINSPGPIVLGNGATANPEELQGQDIFFHVHPDDIEDYLKWKGNSHGEGFDVIEVLSIEDIKKYLND